MSEDKIRYDILASEAFRGLIRTVLQKVQKRGLPGEHHFYVTFDTTAPGTIQSKRLKDQYPDEMTIVLQHQFWDFQVYEDRFEVKLSFNNVPERLVIPFAAIRSFVDPSVGFVISPNLLLQSPNRDTAMAGSPLSAETQDRDALPPAAQASPDQDVEAKPKNEDAAAAKGEDDPADPDEQTAKVVELDAFRKK